MKSSLGLSIILLFGSTTAGANEFQSGEAVVGWGVEYRFGSTQEKFDFYAFSKSDLRQEASITKYSYRDAQKVNRLSCAPEEGDPDAKCSVGWFGPMVYVIALPISLYLYKEMFGIE